MLSSIVPILSSAAIPEQTVTLTISPFWLSSLFLTALALACGALWFLAHMDRESHRQTVTATPLQLAFPRPSASEAHGTGQAA
ncbi:MAG: hypothetical protein AB1689_18545 [Thermodesulfobacteriota bacterium]